MSLVTFEKAVSPDDLKYQIEEAIFSDKLSIGERLPTERMISEMTGLNLSTVHGVIKALCFDGFLKTVPRHGTYVLDYTAHITSEGFSSWLQNSYQKILPQQYIHAIQVETALEMVAAHNLIERNDPHALDEAIALVASSEESYEKGNRDNDYYARMFVKEVRLLASSSQNLALSSYFNSFHRSVEIIANSWVAHTGIGKMLHERKEFHRLILAREEGAAIQCLIDSRKDALGSGGLPPVQVPADITADSGTV